MGNNRSAVLPKKRQESPSDLDVKVSAVPDAEVKTQPLVERNVLTSESAGVPFKLLGAALARTWPAVLAMSLCAGFLAYQLFGMLPSQYTSEARVLVGSLQGTGDSLRASASLSTTYADSLAAESTLEAAAENLGLQGAEVEELHELASVTANEKSRIITVKTTTRDAIVSQRLANELLVELSSIRDEIEIPSKPQGLTPGESLDLELSKSVGALHIVQRPTLPTKPDATLQLPFSIIVGTLVGLLMYGLCVFVAHRHYMPMASIRDNATEPSVIGAVRLGSKDIQQGAAWGKASKSESSTYNKVARSAIYKFRGSYPGAILSGAMSDPMIGAGFAARMAVALARQGCQVHFIDLTDGMATRALEKETSSETPEEVLRRITMCHSSLPELEQDLSVPAKKSTVYYIALGTMIDDIGYAPKNLRGWACYAVMDAPTSTALGELHEVSGMLNQLGATMGGAVIVDNSRFSGALFQTAAQVST